MKRPVVIFFIYFALGIISYLDNFLGLLIFIAINVFFLANKIVKTDILVISVFIMIAGTLFTSFSDYHIPYGQKQSISFDLIKTNGDYYDGKIIEPLIYKGKKVKISSQLKLEEGIRYKADGCFGKDYTQFNPNTFNFEYYNKASNSLGFYYANSIVKEMESFSYYEKIRMRVGRKIIHIVKQISSQHWGTFYSFVSGDDSYVKESDVEKYRDISIAHLMAVSGFHIALIHGVVTGLLRILKIRKNRSKIFSLCTLLVYVLFISSGVSSFRACVFILIHEISYFINRRRDMLCTLSVTGIILLLVNPFVLWDIGFQLSFAAVLSILLFVPVVKRYVKWDALAIPIAVNFLILPVSIYWFGKIYIFSIIANVIMVFLFGLFYPLLLLGIVINSLMINFLWINNCISFFYDVFYKIIDFFWNLSQMEFAQGSRMFLYENISVHWILLMFLLFLILTMIFYNERKLNIKKNIVITVSLLVVVYIVSYKSINIKYFDVGQGDCICIEKGSHRILIDSGYDYKEGNLENILLRNGIKDIDVFILSHCHRDHYGGLINFEKVKVDKIYMTLGNGSEKFEKFKDSIHYIKNTQKISIASLELLMIPGIDNDDNINNRSMYVILNDGNNKYLFTGDGEKELEERNLKKFGDYLRNTDVLKVPHHGSKTSSSPEFISKSMARYAIIQVGENKYGLPDDSVIDRYLNQGVKVYDNQRDGCVSITALGRFYMIRTYKRR